MPKQVSFFLGFSLVFVLLCASPVLAQFDTASVLGTVPDASVTLTNTATGVSATRISSAEGLYEFVTVRPDTYIVTAEKPGFSIALVDNVEVQVGARLRVDLQ